MKKLLFVLLLTASTACQAFESPEALQEGFMQALLAEDAEALAACYAEDATNFTLDRMKGVGPPSAYASWSAFFEQYDLLSAELSDKQMVRSGDLAAAWGLFTIVVRPAGGGDPLTFTGRYLDVAQPVDGQWLYVADHASMPFPPAEQMTDAEARLLAVLERQPVSVQKRYGARHPADTLGFFGIEPGMTVVEALPGGGWYSKILIDYLGPEGGLVGADYAQDMWPLFGMFPDDFIASKATWPQDWSAGANEWVEGGAPVSAFQLGTLPEYMEGTADAVLFIRALHNLARFEDQGGFLAAALADAHAVLKPGGIVGIVQHEARPDMPDDFATGARGYLKKEAIVEAMAAAGFEFVGASDINANPDDQPGPEDVVWRLPPSLATTREDPEGQAAMRAIGESNRMTLKFRKPE